jgi:hypothetical protein
LTDLLPPGNFSFFVKVTFAQTSPGILPPGFSGFAWGPAPFGPWQFTKNPFTPTQQILRIGNAGPLPTSFTFEYQDPQGRGFPPILFPPAPPMTSPTVSSGPTPIVGQCYSITVDWDTTSQHTEYVSRSESNQNPVFVARQELLPGGGNIDWSEMAVELPAATHWIVEGGSRVWTPDHVRGLIVPAGSFPPDRKPGQGVSYFW